MILKFSTKDCFHSIVLGLLGTYLYYILLYFEYANANGIEFLIIQYCWPIFVIVFSICIFKGKTEFKESDFSNSWILWYFLY
ncbi:MAG: EamA family transporter [Marinifilaceae bacterium]|nr:EamA family transporter [Marinifilaceae bacterium]